MSQKLLIELTIEQKKWLKEQGKANLTPMAAVIRELINKEMKKDK